MMKANFSVIIPTHKRNNFLLEAIESVLGQSFPPKELIIVDDFPQKETKDIVQATNRRSDIDCIYVVNDQQPGAIRSRNIGEKYSTGNYLAFLDDDDLWESDYLYEVQKKISETNSKVVLSWIKEFDEDGNFQPFHRNPSPQFHFDEFVLKNPGTLCSNFVIARELFQTIGGYDEFVRGSADKDIFIQTQRFKAPFAVIRHELVMRRMTPGGQWTGNMSKILPGLIRFYLKYFFRIKPHLHLKMLDKLKRRTKRFTRDLVKQA